MSLECKNITKVFGHETILNHINYSFKDSIITMIQGKSGSGKTTLLNILSGHLEVDSGEVNNDYEMTRIVFQNHYLLEELNVKENILTGVESVGDIDKEYYNYLIDTLGIRDCLSKRVKQCSQGECQRINIARAFIAKPDLVLMDEPTGNLDNKNTHELMKMIKTLQKELGLTILFISHDISLEAYMDEVLYLDQGQLKVIKEAPEKESNVKLSREIKKLSFMQIIRYVSEFILYHKKVILFQCICISICAMTIFLGMNIGSNLRDYYYQAASEQPNHLNITITSSSGKRIMEEEVNEIKAMEHVSNVYGQSFIYGWERDELHSLEMISKTHSIKENDQAVFDAYLLATNKPLLEGTVPKQLSEVVIDTLSARQLNVGVGEQIEIVLPYTSYYNIEETQDLVSLYPFTLQSKANIVSEKLTFTITGIVDDNNGLYRGMAFHESLEEYFLNIVRNKEIPEGTIAANSLTDMIITIDQLENVTKVYEQLSSQYNFGYQNTVITIMEGLDDLKNIEDIYKIISTLIAIVMCIILLVLLNILFDKKDKMIHTLSLFNFSSQATKWFYVFESIFIMMMSFMFQLIILNVFVPFFNQFLFKVNPIVFQLQIALDNRLQLLNMSMGQILLSYGIITIGILFSQWIHYRSYSKTNAVMFLKEGDDV